MIERQYIVHAARIRAMLDSTRAFARLVGSLRDQGRGRRPLLRPPAEGAAGTIDIRG